MLWGAFFQQKPAKQRRICGRMPAKDRGGIDVKTKTMTQAERFPGNMWPISRCENQPYEADTKERSTWAGGGDITENLKSYYGVFITDITEILRILRRFITDITALSFWPEMTRNFSELTGNEPWKFLKMENVTQTFPKRSNLGCFHAGEQFKYTHDHTLTQNMGFVVRRFRLVWSGSLAKVLPYYGYYGILRILRNFLLRNYYGYYGAVISPPCTDSWFGASYSVCDCS